MDRRTIVAYFMVIGVILGLFYSLENDRLTSAEDEDRDELIRLYEEQLEIQSQLLAEQESVHAERQKQRDEYLDGGPDEMIRVANLRSELNEARTLAGFTPLMGSGLEIRMSDATGIDYATATSEQIIHDSQLRFIVDWLKIQEVYGIAINGERVTNQSKIICNGPTVQVNRVMHGMPYIIEAVTSPDLPAHMLKPALDNLEPVKHMRSSGIVIEIREVETIILPAFEDQQMINEAISILTLQPQIDSEKPAGTIPAAPGTQGMQDEQDTPDLQDTQDFQDTQDTRNTQDNPADSRSHETNSVGQDLTEEGVEDESS